MLWTKQPVGVNNIQRAVLLSKKDPTFMFVTDDAQVVDWLEEAAAAHKTKVRVAVSVFAGMARQGIDGGQAGAGAGAESIFLQAHAVRRLHGLLRTARRTPRDSKNGRKQSMDVLAGVRESRDLAKKSGLPVNIMTGGSTGTYNIDHETGLTELEAGTYVFMDTEYFIVGGKDGDMKRYNDWKPALTVLTTVDSQHHPNIITTDYGNKALAKKTDEVKGMPWLERGRAGSGIRCLDVERRATRRRSWATGWRFTAPTWTRAPTPSTATTSPRATRSWTCGPSWAAAARRNVKLPGNSSLLAWGGRG